MEELESEYPGILDIVSAQDEFGVPDCIGNYKVWIMHITNKTITDPRPEVLFMGGHHGDEPVSVEAAFYFAKWLVSTYDQDPQTRYLVDNRDIYIIPLVNPWGLEHKSRYNGNGADINRDYPFGDIYDPLNTTEARAVYELQSRHQFINGLTWHAGTVAIGYSWGCGYYDNGASETPDDAAFSAVAQKMSEVAGSSMVTYPYGRMDQMPQYGPLEGTWEDFAYAGAWDNNNYYPGLVCNGSRTLSFITEISYAKEPPVTDLGTTEGVKSGGTGDGYIPKNIRMGLLLTDLARPYIDIIEEDKIPISANAGDEVEMGWTIGGCLDVDDSRILYGKDTSVDAIIRSPQYSTALQSGSGIWSDAQYAQKIIMPDDPGTYTFVIESKVDQALKYQYLPTPSIAPQSFYINQRTNENWSSTNHGHTLTGQVYYYSDPVNIEVQAKPQQTGVKVELLTGSGPIKGPSNVQINWTVELASSATLELTMLQWGSDPDPKNNLQFISEELNESDAVSKQTNGSNKVLFFVMTLNLKASSIDQYIIAMAKKDGVNYWSSVIKMWLCPSIVIDGYTAVPRLEGTLEVRWHIEGATHLEFTRALLSYYTKVETTYHVEFGNFSKERTTYSANTTLPFRSGAYYILIQVKSGDIWIGSEQLEFYLGPELKIIGPTVELNISGEDGPGTQPLLKIGGSKAISSIANVAEVGPSEATSAYYVIYDDKDRNRKEGALIYDANTSSWGASQTISQDLEDGKYYVLCYFEVGPLFNSSSHAPGDHAGFEIRTKDTVSEDKQSYYTIWIIVSLVGLLVLMFIIFVFFKVKAMDAEPEPKKVAKKSRTEISKGRQTRTRPKATSKRPLR